MKKASLIINAYFLAHPFSGQGVYTVQLLPHLLQDYDGPVILLALDNKSYSAAKKWQRDFPKIRIQYFSLPGIPLRLQLLLAELFWIPYILRKSHDYIYFSPYPHPVLFLPNDKKHFMTLHDAIFFTTKEYSSKWSRKVYNALLRHTVRNKGIQLLTVSKTSSEEIIRLLRPAHTPLVAYNGIDHLHKEELLSKDTLQSRFHIPGAYLFYHGGYDKRKNVAYAVEIYKSLRIDNPALSLVLGGKALYDSNLYLQLEHTAGIIQTGFISNSELRSLYYHAAAFISPSMQEGFNIPIGEALMEDTPVLASDIPVHRELWNEYATLIPLHSLHNAVTIAKETLRQERKPFSSHMYTWRNCSKKILEYFG